MKGTYLQELNKQSSSKAQTPACKIEYVFLVEGYMDVIGLTKNKIENVVANLGTSLTEKQISIIVKTKSPTMQKAETRR